MSLSLKLKPDIHDLNFQFKDSCNCCCWRMKPFPANEDLIFITKDGRFEKFNLKKAKDQLEANRVTIIRLNKRLDDLSKSIKIESPIVKEKIFTELGKAIDTRNLNSLNYGQLQKINSVFVSTVMDNAKSEGQVKYDSIAGT